MDYKIKQGAINPEYRSLDDYTDESICFYEGNNVKYIETLTPLSLVLNKALRGKFCEIFDVDYFYVEDPKKFYFEQFLKDVEPAIYKYRRIGSSQVAPNVIWGEDCHFEGNSMVHSNTTIGDRVSIKSGAVLGGQGFNVVAINGKSQMLPHIGGVKIGNGVFIGSNTCIDKGVLGDTEIGNNTKIDNLVHIAHNCEIGSGVTIGAGAIIGGSTVIDDNAIVHIGEIISSHSHIEVTEDKNVCDVIENVKTKLIITDLDNTLWEGVVGFETEIKVHGKYLELQRKLKALSQKGILLAIISKNNHYPVMNTLAHHKDMILRPDDFVAYRINWKDKATNLTEILSELNLTNNGIIFIDDSPYERDYMQNILPEIHTITNEDLNKLSMYKVEKVRQKNRKRFSNIEDWIKSLDMKISIELMVKNESDRVLQLINKTNQMNLNGKRLAKLPTSSDIWVCKVIDKFGAYGIVATIIIEKNIVTHFAMSCRAIGRKIEYVIFDYLFKYYKILLISPVKTLDNAPCLEFFKERKSRKHKLHNNNAINNE